MRLPRSGWLTVACIGVGSVVALMHWSGVPPQRSDAASAHGGAVQPDRAHTSVAGAGTGAVIADSAKTGASLPYSEPARSSRDSAAQVDVPVRRAIDSGRAQPIFIALRAPATARVGEPFEIAVTGESENDFARVALSLQFDPRKLRVVGVRQGNWMARAGAEAAFSYAVDPQAGRLSIELSENHGGNPISGGGTLCSVEFVAVAPGLVSPSIAGAAVGDLNDEGVSYSLLPPPAVVVRE